MPRAADLLHRMTMVAQDIASRPDVGPYEVGVLQELTEYAGEIAGTRERAERQAQLRRYHLGPGRAVDWVPGGAGPEYELRGKYATGVPRIQAVDNELAPGERHIPD